MIQRKQREVKHGLLLTSTTPSRWPCHKVDHNIPMCHRLLLKKWLESHWGWIDAQLDPLSCSFFPDGHKSHCQRGMSRPGEPASCSCLCLPFGSEMLQSDSCKWQQRGAGLRSSSHSTGPMGSVSCWRLRNLVGFRCQLRTIQPAHYALNIDQTQPCVS